MGNPDGLAIFRETFGAEAALSQGARIQVTNLMKVGFSMKFNESLVKVKRLRWMMRQKSQISRLLRLPIAVAIDCPFCRTKVGAGDFFCCSELEHFWGMTEETPVEPAENTSSSSNGQSLALGLPIW
jgi:hypothetical protein